MEKKGSFWAGFAQAFSLIFVSEIGDKTFILVTIYASKFAWYWVLPIAILGMSIMHSLSTGLGMIFVLFVPRVWTQSVAILLFWLMGFYSLYQGVREYVERARRKAKGLPETESESEDERAELEKIVREQEAIAAGQKAEVSQESQPAEAKDIELAIPDGERNEDPAPAGGEAPEIKDAPASEPATKVEPSKEEPKAQEK